MIEELNLDHIRQTLVEERLSLKQRIQEYDQKNGRQINRNLDRADLAQSYTQQEKIALRVDREQAQLIQVETALQKLDEGCYGVCDNCDQTISYGRLQVLPYANLCIRCQSQMQS